MNSRREHYLNLISSNEKTPAGLQPAEVVNRTTNHQESRTAMTIITHTQDATKAPNPWGVLLEVGDELILRDGRIVKPGEPVWLAQVIDDGDPWREGVYFFLTARHDNHPIYTTKPGEIYSYDLDGEHFAYRFITAATFSHYVILDGDKWSVLRRVSDPVQEVPC